MAVLRDFGQKVFKTIFNCWYQRVNGQKKIKAPNRSHLKVEIPKMSFSEFALVGNNRFVSNIFEKKFKSSQCVWRVASNICLFRYILCVATLGLSYTGTKETKHPKQMHPPFFTVFLTIRHAEQNLSPPCMHYRTLFFKSFLLH